MVDNAIRAQAHHDGKPPPAQEDVDKHLLTVHTRYDEVEDYAIPASGFELALVDKPKKTLGKNEANAGFFGANPRLKYTVPAGHLVAKMEATDPNTVRAVEAGGSVKDGKVVYPSLCTGRSPVTTLTIRGGKPQINELWGIPPCEYAIAGIPVVRHGEAVTSATAFGQGWDRSSCRPTKHIFYGLRRDDTAVHMLVINTKTQNLIDSAEVAGRLIRRGYVDVIKVDGGGSLEVHADTGDISTGGNRRICSSCRYPRVVAGPVPAAPTVM